MYISRHWRTPKVVFALFILEFPLTIAILALFGIADPDLYRTKLWKQGADLGFNSSPSEILYSYANHRPIKVPLVWSQFATNFNLVICVISMFVLLTKTVMHVLHVLYPFLSFVVHAVLVALYAVSVHNQTAPDLSDPLHPAKGAPWYITHSCSLSGSDQIKGYCQQAKASFAVTVVMLVLFAMHLPLAAWSVIPTTQQRFASDTSIESVGFTKCSPRSVASSEQQWEMQQYQRVPGTAGGMKSPMTPRTVAFNVLGGGSRDLHLRGK